MLIMLHSMPMKKLDTAKSEILAALGEGYVYVGTESINKEKIYTMRHKICGTDISGSFKKFVGTKYIRAKRCPLCFKYKERTRILQQSDAGKAIEEMTTWFKDHKIWTVWHHAKINNSTYKKLVVNGFIRHIGFGMYSPVQDINIYEILEERYLKDIEGNTIGRFIDDTADFIAGVKNEPETITLETSMLMRTSKHIYTICGRKVSVRGTR